MTFSEGYLRRCAPRSVVESARRQVLHPSIDLAIETFANGWRCPATATQWYSIPVPYHVASRSECFLEAAESDEQHTLVVQLDLALQQTMVVLVAGGDGLRNQASPPRTAHEYCAGASADVVDGQRKAISLLTADNATQQSVVADRMVAVYSMTGTDDALHNGSVVDTAHMEDLWVHCVAVIRPPAHRPTPQGSACNLWLRLSSRRRVPFGISQATQGAAIPLWSSGSETESTLFSTSGTRWHLLPFFTCLPPSDLRIAPPCCAHNVLAAKSVGCRGDSFAAAKSLDERILLSNSALRSVAISRPQTLNESSSCYEPSEPFFSPASTVVVDGASMRRGAATEETPNPPLFHSPLYRSRQESHEVSAGDEPVPREDLSDTMFISAIDLESNDTSAVVAQLFNEATHPPPALHTDVSSDAMKTAVSHPSTKSRRVVEIGLSRAQRVARELSRSAPRCEDPDAASSSLLFPFSLRDGTTETASGRRVYLVLAAPSASRVRNDRLKLQNVSSGTVKLNMACPWVVGVHVYGVTVTMAPSGVAAVVQTLEPNMGSSALADTPSAADGSESGRSISVDTSEHTGCDEAPSVKCVSQSTPPKLASRHLSFPRVSPADVTRCTGTVVLDVGLATTKTPAQVDQFLQSDPRVQKCCAAVHGGFGSHRVARQVAPNACAAASLVPVNGTSAVSLEASSSTPSNGGSPAVFLALDDQQLRALQLCEQLLTFLFNAGVSVKLPRWLLEAPQRQ